VGRFGCLGLATGAILSDLTAVVKPQSCFWAELFGDDVHSLVRGSSPPVENSQSGHHHHPRARLFRNARKADSVGCGEGIERPKNAANASEGAATRPIEAGKTLDAACADVRMYKIADDRRRQ